MSINLCTDNLVLALLPPARIASVSWLARDPSLSARAGQAAAVPINHGTAEEVLAERPDLVLAGTVTTPATLAVLSRLGIRLLVIPPAESFSQIRAVTRRTAAALGEVALGEAMIARMDATLTTLAWTAPRHKPRVLAWDGGSYVPGRGSLFDALLAAAGALNLADALPGAVGLEQVIWLHPDVLIRPVRQSSSQQGTVLDHPALAELPRQVAFSDALASCGTPDSADGAVALRAAIRP